MKSEQNPSPKASPGPLSFNENFPALSAHIPLYQACPRGDLSLARALFHDGLEISLALLKNASTHDPATLKYRGRALYHLIEIGADPSVALARAVSDHCTATKTACEIPEHHVSAIRTLLLLGADGADALSAVLDDRNPHAVRLLLRAGVSAENALCHCASLGDSEALSWFRGGKINMVAVVDQLIRRDDDRAIAQLVTSGVDLSEALLHYLASGDHRTVKRLLLAGAPTHALMTSLADGQTCVHGNTIILLAGLIAAGADPGRILFDAATRGDDVIRAERLLLAGASVSSALTYTSTENLMPIRKKLFMAWTKVSLIKVQVQQSDKTVEADITIVEKLLTAISHSTTPEAQSITNAIIGITDALRTKGHHDAATLLLALNAADWPTIRKHAANTEAASKAVRYATELGHQSALRLLQAINAPITDAIEYALHEDDVDALHQLVIAHWPCHRIITLIANRGNLHLARTLINKSKVNTLKLLRSIASDAGDQYLKQIIPDIVNGHRELLEACVAGDAEFARCLIASGVDASGALALAVAESCRDGIAALLNAGADLSLAVTHATAKHYDHAVQRLFALGANPTQTFAQATD